MTKADNEDFVNSFTCWICHNDYVDNYVEVRDHCQIVGKYRGSAHTDCKSNLKLNHKIPILFDKQKNSLFSSYYARTRQIQS